MKSLFGLVSVGVGAWLAGSTAVAQVPASLPNAMPMDGKPSVTPSAAASPSLAQPGTVENWQTGQTTALPSVTQSQLSAPIGTDFYFRSGPTQNFGGGAIRHNTNSTGLEIEGGGRTLFFDASGTAAWAIDVGLNFVYDRGSANHTLNLTDNKNTFDETASIHNVDRTALQIGIGRDWYPVPSASVTPDSTSFWKTGIDAGMRYGTGHVGFNNIQTDGVHAVIVRNQDVFGGTYLGLNLNREIPLGGTWTYVVGFRNEWSYTFSSLVPGNRSNLYEVSLLFNMGLRY